jgi:hypothetical protein
MKRLQFDISDERAKELDDLVERTGLKTRAQLFNTALSLFEWAVREREAGCIIASVNEKNDKYKEIDMPGFPVKKEDGEVPEEWLRSLFTRLMSDEELTLKSFNNQERAVLRKFLNSSSSRSNPKA